MNAARDRDSLRTSARRPTADGRDARASSGDRFSRYSGTDPPEIPPGRRSQPAGRSTSDRCRAVDPTGAPAGAREASRGARSFQTVATCAGSARPGEGERLDPRPVDGGSAEDRSPETRPGGAESAVPSPHVTRKDEEALPPSEPPAREKRDRGAARSRIPAAGGAPRRRGDGGEARRSATQRLSDSEAGDQDDMTWTPGFHRAPLQARRRDSRSPLTAVMRGDDLA